MKKLPLFILFLINAMISGFITKGQNGVIASYAGTGVAGYSGDGGLAVLAKLDTPGCIASDKYGNLYIGDGVWIRKVDPSGIISTIAGCGIQGFSGDGGPATAAKLIWPMSITVDVAGNIYFGDSSRIRKINTSGIITTLAGSSIIGYSGDGGPATAAEIDYPTSIAVGGTGNIYIADGGNSCIRMINTTGIISTVAGTGISGYFGDGGIATAAKLSYPSGLAFDKLGNLYIADGGNNRIRKINTSGIISTIAGTGPSGSYGDGRLATLAQLSYPSKVSVDNNENVFILDNQNKIREISFNDGKINTIAGNGGSSSKGNGGFGRTAQFYAYDLAIDTFSNFYVLEKYKSIVRKTKQMANIGLYIDVNSDCAIDGGDNFISQPSTIEVDSNGICIDTISVTSGFSYNTKGNPGDIYTFKIITGPAGLSVSCPASGIIYDTIRSLVGNYFTKNIGFQCTSTGVDLVVKNCIQETWLYGQRGYIYVANNGCTPTNAVVTLCFSPKYLSPTTSVSWANPSYSSLSGNIITWNLFGLSNKTGCMDISYSIRNPSSTIDSSDIVYSTATITPTIGDNDTTNNYSIRFDTVKLSHDPNYIEVSPSGCLPPVTIPTPLQYTINFENTGNDTAFNIYVMDSLSDNLDPQSFRIVAASAAMNTSRIYSGGHAIIKFDFPNINLLDSSHHGQCDGMIMYTINTKTGLPKGTTIFNQAGIYFDNNSVVETNVVENILDCTGLNVTTVGNQQNVEIYPNPATDELTVKMDQDAYNSCTVTNSIGQVLILKQLNAMQTLLNVKTLPPGLYYIIFKGSNTSKVQKFVKM